VDQPPEPTYLVGLEFQKVIAAAERAELNSAVARGKSSKRWIAQRLLLQDCREFARLSMFIRGDSLVESRQHGAGSPFVVDRRRLDVERDGRHAATNVAADGRGVNQFLGGDDRSNAHLLREMHIGHQRYRTDVFRLPEPLDGLIDLLG
jgi:hypothetical protein